MITRSLVGARFARARVGEFPEGSKRFAFGRLFPEGSRPMGARRIGATSDLEEQLKSSWNVSSPFSSLAPLLRF